MISAKETIALLIYSNQELHKHRGAVSWFFLIHKTQKIQDVRSVKNKWFYFIIWVTLLIYKLASI